MTSKRYYSVQHGDDYSDDYGTTVKREAYRMARRLARDPRYDGEEIRIALMYLNMPDEDYAEGCDGTIIIREGTC